MRGARAQREEGFTLIELLVVMVIIGVLAAIALPTFLQQRTKAVDSSMRTDLRTLALAEETYFTDHQAYLPVGASSRPVILDEIHLGSQAVASVEVGASGQAFCVRIDAARSSGPRTYLSHRGGLQAVNMTTCPGPASY